MNIICGICGQPMDYEVHEMWIGSNEPHIVVLPCCPPEEVDHKELEITAVSPRKSIY